jgi:hypothetical protein
MKKLLPLFASFLLAACHGEGDLNINGPQIITPTGPVEVDPTPTTVERQPLCKTGDTDMAGPRLLRRLTLPEYETSIRKAFALDAAAWPGSTLPPDAAAANGFNNNADRLLVNDTVA